MFKLFRTSALFLTLMTLLLGGIYPTFIWLVGQIAFSEKANGSLIIRQEQVIGSSLLGQHFTSDRYFWGRLSATESFPYNAQHSGSNHLNADHPELIENAKARIVELLTPTGVLQTKGQSSTLRNTKWDSRLRGNDGSGVSIIPIDLVTTSASGLDPHISPQAARIQIARIAKTRNIPETKLNKLIYDSIIARDFGFLGEPRVNVLQLNLALDKMTYGR